MSDTIERDHSYHAEATVLEGHLRLPLTQEIKPQTSVKLPERGGYIAQHSAEYRLGAVISFRSAYTQVAGNIDVKPGHGWTTLATSVVEGLNVLDVVTADRVVAQIAIEHPLVGYVPSVSFLGTRFENLRIAGHPVKLDLDLDLFDSRPANDAPYTRDSGFIGRVSSQHQRIRQHQDLPPELLERYNRLPASFDGGTENQETLECSLVNQADGSFPGRSFGHAIKIPDFGVIYLATLRLEQSDFQKETGIPRQTLIHLTMIELKMGCIAVGTAQAAQLIVNGRTKP